MAALVAAFNAQQFDPTQSAGQLPVGRHPVVVEASEVKATKAGDGGYLQLTLKIIDGPQTGVTGSMRLNLYAQSQQASEIAHRQLSAICHAIGQFVIQDSAQLHGHPFMVEVSPQKTDPQYTEVKKILDINGNEPGKGQAPQQTIQQPAAQAQFAPQQQPVQTLQAPAQNPAWGQQPEAVQQAPAWGQPQQAPMQQPIAGNPSQAAAPAWGQQAPAQQPAPAWGAPAAGGPAPAPAWGR